jgi:predicted ATPase
MPKLDKITIEGYKSIKSLKDFELKDINILIGANGAGKSNFLSLFEMLHFLSKPPSDYWSYTQRKGGANALLHFGTKNTDEMFFALFAKNEAWELFLKASENNEIIPNFEKKDAPSGLSKVVSNWGLYHIDDTSGYAKIKGMPAENDNLVLKSGGENLAPYLKMIKRKYPQHYENIIETIRMVLPSFGDFIIRNDEEYIQLEWFEKGHSDTPFKAHLLSDGTLRFMCLATLLLQPLKLIPDIILLDEPELGLHPYAVSILSGLIQSVAGEKQFVIATQSMEFIDEFKPDDIVIVEHENHETTFKRLDSKKLENWIKDYSLGQLWNSNILGGNP